LSPRGAAGATHQVVAIREEPVAKGIHGVGFPPLPELIAKVVQAKIPVYV
jgi:hypothetical protein